MRSPLAVLVPFAACAACAALAAACGGAQNARLPTDPMALFEAGDYRAARLAAKARGGESPVDRAIIALTFVAEHADGEAKADAVSALRGGATEAEAIAAASQMLTLFAGTPKLVDEERSLLVIEAALDAAERSAEPGGAPRIEDAPEETRWSLALALLERLRSCLEASTEFSTARILAIWNGCFTLLGGSMQGSSELRSWLLYLNVSGLAVLVSEAAPGSDLANALLASAVAVVEENPLMAVAVRCDLSSPFDGLRAALALRRELGARLERAVEKALGCTRGRYAPGPSE